MSRDVGVNTEPLNVQIYISNDGRICWRIDDIKISNNSNISPSTVVETIEEKHLINEHFDNIFMINCKKLYGFINMSIPVEGIIVQPPTITYETFDYILFCMQHEQMAKESAWRMFIGGTECIVNYSNEMGYINAIIKTIDIAIGKSYKNCFIIFNDDMPSMATIHQIVNDESDDLTLTVIGESYGYKKQFKSINALIINELIYDDFTNFLKEQIRTWRMAILSYVERNYFNVRLVHL